MVEPTDPNMPTSSAECGCPTYPIDGGFVDVIHFAGCEFHDEKACLACGENG